MINAQGSVKDPALCSHPCPDTVCPCHAITTKFTPKCTKPIGLQHFVMIFCHVWCGQKESWVHIKHFSRTRHKRCDLAFGLQKNELCKQGYVKLIQGQLLWTHLKYSGTKLFFWTHHMLYATFLTKSIWTIREVLEKIDKPYFLQYQYQLWKFPRSS